jgi:MFS family permease
MASITRPLSWFNWFYNEFGLASIQATGRNAYLIITARTMRMISFGGTQVMLGTLVILPAIDHELTSVLPALFFAELKFTDFQIGLFMTLTLLGDVFLGLFLTMVADRVGRRKILFAGSGLMVLSGLLFSYFENFWILLMAAIVGEFLLHVYI